MTRVDERPPTFPDCAVCRLPADPMALCKGCVAPMCDDCATELGEHCKGCAPVIELDVAFAGDVEAHVMRERLEQLQAELAYRQACELAAERDLARARTARLEHEGAISALHDALQAAEQGDRRTA